MTELCHGGSLSLSMPWKNYNADALGIEAVNQKKSFLFYYNKEFLAFAYLLLRPVLKGLQRGHLPFLVGYGSD